MGRATHLLKSSMVLAIAGATVPAHAAAVDLDINTKHQIVDGFGASQCNITPWRIKVGPFWHTVDLEEVGFYDSIGQDMEIMRTLVPQMQHSEGGPYDDVQFPHVAELAQRGVSRFWGSVLSPPAWMKDNNSVTQGGHLLPEYYDDFGRMCAEYARQFREKIGIDLYGLSLQNEPLFVEPYASCVYNNATYRDLHKVVGPIVKAVSPNTKFMGAEDVLVSASRCNGWIQTILADPDARDYMDIYATHCHSMIFDQVSDPYNSWWNTVQTVADPNGLPLWMSEVGDNFDTTWPTAVKLASTIGMSFRHGNCAAWVWWTFTADNDNAMIREGVYNGKYYQMAHYGRFVKAGARRIESSCSDGQLNEVAFENSDGSVVVVVVNTNGSARSASVSGSSLPSTFYAYQSTSPTSVMQDQGAVSVGVELPLPANSITTFSSKSITQVREQVRRAAAQRMRAVCRPAMGGAAVAVRLAAPSRVSLAVFTVRGDLAARAKPVAGSGEVVLQWTAGRPTASGTYLAHILVRPLKGGTATEHFVKLSPR